MMPLQRGWVGNLPQGELLPRDFWLRRDRSRLFPGFLVGRAVNGFARLLLELLVGRRRIFAAGVEGSKGKDERDNYLGHFAKIVRRIDVLQRSQTGGAVYPNRSIAPTFYNVLGAAVPPSRHRYSAFAVCDGWRISSAAAA